MFQFENELFVIEWASQALQRGGAELQEVQTFGVTGLTPTAGIPGCGARASPWPMTPQAEETAAPCNPQPVPQDYSSALRFCAPRLGF